MPDWITALGSLGSIATPIVVLILTAIGRRYRQSIERRLQLEEKLRDDRVAIYNKILEPFIIAFTPEAVWKSDSRNKHKDKSEAMTSSLLSMEYRQTAFKLSLIGSDAVIRAYNDLMQNAFNMPASGVDALQLKKVCFYSDAFYWKYAEALATKLPLSTTGLCRSGSSPTLEHIAMAE